MFILGKHLTTFTLKLSQRYNFTLEPLVVAFIYTIVHPTRPAW